MEESVEPQGLPDAAQVLILLMCTRHYTTDRKNRSYSVLQKVLDGSRGEGAPRPRVDVQSLNTRGYLDHTVVPILLDAMAAVAKERWARVTTPVEMHALHQFNTSVSQACRSHRVCGCVSDEAQEQVPAAVHHIASSHKLLTYTLSLTHPYPPTCLA